MIKAIVGVAVFGFLICASFGYGFCRWMLWCRRTDDCRRYKPVEDEDAMLFMDRESDRTEQLNALVDGLKESQRSDES